MFVQNNFRTRPVRGESVVKKIGVSAIKVPSSSGLGVKLCEDFEESVD